MLAASTDFATRDLHTYTRYRATLAGRNRASRNADLFLARSREDQVFVVCSVLSPGSILAMQSRVCASENSGSDVRHTWRPCSTSTVARFSMLFPPFYERPDTNAISEHAQLPVSSSLSLPLFSSPFFPLILQFFPTCNVNSPYGY